MINVADIVADADLQAPQPFTILRSTGQFVLGGFDSAITTTIEAYGPVQRATSKEVQMLPEGDRVGAIMAFWWTQPILLTTGKAPVPSTHGEVPAGDVPGSVYTLSSAPVDGGINLFRNGLLQRVPYDYTIDGATITLARPTVTGEQLYVTWPVTLMVGTNAADVLVYNGEKYRVLDVKNYPGSGYWKALGTRISAM